MSFLHFFGQAFHDNGHSFSDGRLFGATDGRGFSNTCVHDSLLNCNFLAESLERIVALEFLKLNRRVLVEELVDGQVTTANTNLDVVLLDLDSDTLRAELVDTLGLTHEHDLQLLTLGIVVDVFGEFLVDRIFLHWDVNGDSLLQVDDVLLEACNLNLGVFQLLEHLKAYLVRLVNLFLHDESELRRLLQLQLKSRLDFQLHGQLFAEALVFLREHVVALLLRHGELVEGDVRDLELGHFCRLLRTKSLVLYKLGLKHNHLLG